MRVAVYATPARGSLLARLGAGWLGRDAFTGEPTRAPDPLRDPLLAEPARYGFHATLKAPFRLKDERDLGRLVEGLDAFAESRSGPVIRRLVLSRLGAFFALVPDAVEPDVAALEAEVLRAFEPFRAPLDDTEIAARRPGRLTANQRTHLDRWGYPFVLDEFRFHMTVTGPIDSGADALYRDLAAHFADVLDRPLPLDGLGLFVEPSRGVPFRIHTFHPFGPPAAREPATTP